MKRRLCYQLELGKELADVSTKCCSRHQSESEEVWTNVAIHYCEGTRDWRSKVGEGHSSLPASSSQWPSNQGIPVLHLSWSVPLRVSSRCVGPFSPTAPVLCHGPVLWSPHSWLDGDSPTHVRYSWLLHLLAGISVFLQSCLQSPSGLPDVDMATFWCAVFWWIWVYACSTYGLNYLHYFLPIYLNLFWTWTVAVLFLQHLANLTFYLSIVERFSNYVGPQCMIMVSIQGNVVIPVPNDVSYFFVRYLCNRNVMSMGSNIA